MRLSFKLTMGAMAVAATTFASSAFATGFMLSEQSALLIGRGYAGAGVAGDDISGVFFNPASMTLFPGTNVQASTVWVRCDFPYKELDGSVRENGRLKGQALPTGFLTHQLTENLWFGLGLSVPYGLGTDYSNTWAHADRGTRGYVFTIDINPNIAWKVNDYVSVGGGVSAQYAKAILGFNLPLTAGGMHSRLKVDGWDYSYNLGVMVKPTENVRLGLSYRSAIDYSISGTYQLKGGMLALLGMGSASMNAKAGMKTPATVHLSGAWDINSKWMLTGLVRWSQWSNLDKISIRNNTSALATVSPALAAGLSSLDLHTKWRDTWLYGIGLDYRINDKWTVRGGFAYETNPVKDNRYLLATIPDQTRTWYSVGFSYKASKNLQADFGFSYLKAVGGNATLYENNTTAVGTYPNSNAYIGGFQLRYTF